jgi:hypothetical protein
LIIKWFQDRLNTKDYPEIIINSINIRPEWNKRFRVLFYPSKIICPNQRELRTKRKIGSS